MSDKKMDRIFWTIVGAAAVFALLFFLFGPKARWVSKSYSVDLGAAEETVLVADFSRNAVWRGMPDGMCVILDEQSGGDGAPVTFQLVRTEGRGAAETVEEAARALMPEWNVTFAKGCTVLDPGTKLVGFGEYREEAYTEEEQSRLWREACDAAREADKVVLFLGEHFLQTGEATSRGILELPQIQQKLLREITAVNPNTAVVLFTGRPLDLRLVRKHAKAVLEAWMPGTEGGTALIRTLTGACEPTGRLPMSFPYCVGQVPVHYDEFPTGRPYHAPDENRFLSKYLDIPIQHASDAILKRMGRRHTREDVLELVEKLRSVRPDIVFGADFITGFPTETEEQFEQTLALVREADLKLLHVFPFSVRPGTPSARMPMVSVDVRKKRAEKLRALGEKQLFSYLQGQIGKTDDVLIEENGQGFNTHYIRTRLTTTIAPGTIVRVKNKGIEGNELVAEA